jgi:hypothetical protein
MKGCASEIAPPRMISTLVIYGLVCRIDSQTLIIDHGVAKQRGTLVEIKMSTSNNDQGAELETAEFWDQRYKGAEKVTHEWFRSFESLESTFKEHLEGRTNPRILHLGCGDSVNSSLPAVLNISLTFIIRLFPMIWLKEDT